MAHVNTKHGNKITKKNTTIKNKCVGGGGCSASVLTSELHAHLTTIRRINAV